MKDAQSLSYAIIGYGSQGCSHALNLRDSLPNQRILIGLPAQSSSRKKAKADGFEVLTPEIAVKQSDFIVMLLPDEKQADFYNQSLEPLMKSGKILCFAHGYSVHFQFLKPHPDIDVVLMAPKAIGPKVRERFLERTGVSALIAAYQDASGSALDYAKYYAKAVCLDQQGIFETTFKDETVADLFSEQTLLCGGLSALITSSFEVLVEAGYSPEVAYFECVHEVQLIADLLVKEGLSGTFNTISNTAAFGGYEYRDVLLKKSLKNDFTKRLQDIETGDFAKRWDAEYQAGMPNLKQAKITDSQHILEQTRKRMNQSQ